MAGEAAAIWREEVRGSYPDQRMIALPGRQRLEGWRSGLSPPPPLAHLTGARPVGFGSGTADAEMPASPWLAASNGLITGGTLAILADIAFGCSVETELPAATPYTTAELSLSFLRPAPPGGILSAGGQAIHVGRSVGLSEAFILDRESERLVAHGTSRLTIFPPIDPAPEPPSDLTPFEPEPSETQDPYLRPAPEGVLSQEIWSELPGAEILRRQLAGRLPPPPLHHLTGIRMTGYGERWASASMPSSEWLASPSRRIQGGAIAMLADFAMLIAVQTTTPAGLAFAGLDLKVNFLRPAEPGDHELVARGDVVHAGRSIAITRAVVESAEGKRVALATGSSMYLPGRPASLGELELAAREDDSAQ
ncbi:MAG: PaaI family thioesterase [Solirubrobacterales bacterium]